MPTLGQPEENVQALKGIIGWFNQSSLELVQEYRRLEERGDYLKEQLCFQASSRTITVTDTLLEEITNLKR
jgi:hypothetical protein